MAFRCLKCGSRTQQPEPKCPQCGAEVPNEEQWHGYITFFAIVCLVIVGSPFGAWCIRALTALSTDPSKRLSPGHGLTAVYMAIITAIILAAMAIIIRLEKSVKERKARETR